MAKLMDFPPGSDVAWYPTPAKVTQALLDRETFPGTVWEPACGDGQMSKVLHDNGYNVLSTDLYDYKWGSLAIDFLRVKRLAHDHIESIITTPPYALVPEFIDQALSFWQITKVAMFLKLDFLEGHHDMWTTWPLKKVWIFSNHPDVDAHQYFRYGWFVWDKSYSDCPQIDWIGDSME